jgi:hypothetical protein
MPSFTAVTASPSNRSNIARVETPPAGRFLEGLRAGVVTRDDATRDAARRGAVRSRAPGAM